VVRLRVVRGELPPLARLPAQESAWSRRSTLARGALLGVAAVLLVALPTIGVLALFGVGQLPRGSLICVKASVAAGVGKLVTPPLGGWALLDASRVVAPSAGARR
jgi:hypothetical protein